MTRGPYAPRGASVVDKLLHIGWIVTSSGCWEFRGRRTDKGYGKIREASPSRKDHLAHRVSFEFHNGGIDDRDVLHSCDNPPCVNPSHLRQGDDADNVADKVSRSRQARGEAQNRGVLTERDVVALRMLRSTGGNIAAWARSRGVSEATARSAASGKSWRHVQMGDKK
jgi:hypothetical protein